MQLVYPPEFYTPIVSNFSWVLQLSQEKSKTIVMQSVFFGGVGGGVNKLHNGLCENGE